ncbi:hypothetical protein ES705_36206 [subsurface metagenome]
MYNELRGVVNMSDKTTTISELKEHVKRFVNDRDWTKYHTAKNLSMSIAIEAAELMELYQWVSEEEASTATTDVEKLERLKEELADILIYCLSLANTVNIDVTEAVAQKIIKNETKYPVEQVKGKYKTLLKCKYM